MFNQDSSYVDGRLGEKAVLGELMTEWRSRWAAIVQDRMTAEMNGGRGLVVMGLHQADPDPEMFTSWCRCDS